MSAIREKAADYIIESLRGSNQLAETIDRVMNLEKDPYTAVDELLSTLRISPKGGKKVG